MASKSELEGTLAGFDALRDIMGEDGIQELIDLFIEDGGIHIGALGGALARRDAALLAEEAHALKGSSATLGANQMATLCGQLEQRGRAGTIEGADQLLEALANEFQLVTRFLAKSRQH
ncbi:MAG TPA: Hpt domain-containing protein [Blastocatellia bacterium]|nr:Hpt domain-containing protein [Blastocatellia bacterium]